MCFQNLFSTHFESMNLTLHVGRVTAFPTRLHVRPAKTRSACASAQADQSLRCPLVDSYDLERSIKGPTKILIRLPHLSLRWSHMPSCRECCTPTYIWTTFDTYLIIQHLLGLTLYCLEITRVSVQPYFSMDPITLKGN